MQEHIISFLKKHSGFLSGEEISRQLKISRAAIWKNIEELRKEGYEIEAIPHLGYRLQSTPDKLFPWEIQFDLNTKTLGKQVVYLDAVTSTMDEAFKLAIAGAHEGTIVVAETQTKGKGRLGRSWSSPKGKGIYASIILRPDLPPSGVAQLTLLTAVALVEAIKKITSVNAKIKWPNDVLVENQKLAGILTEMSAEMDRVRFVIVGIGINVNTPSNLLPSHATSLKQESKENISRVELLKEILRSFEKWYLMIHKQGFAPAIKQWKEHTSTLGRHVRVTDPSGTVEGEAIDLDSDGGLIIRKESGVRVKRMTGDVIQMR